MPEMSQAMSVLTSQNTDEWYTPPHVIAWVKEVFGGDIGLDPASCVAANAIVGAKLIYTVEDDALYLGWHAWTLFLNPPFDATPTWLSKLEFAYRLGHVAEAIMLVNSAPGYKWYEAAWREWTVCCLRERLRFIRADFTQDGQAKKGQTLIYFGKDDTRFVEVMRQHGRVFRP